MNKNSTLRIALILIFLSNYNAAHAGDDPKSEPPPNKLTVAYYDFSSGKNAFDINLRHTFKTSTAWIGGYRESTGFDQARVGYEYDYHHEWLTIVPSALAATRGFVGASLYAEMGKRWLGIGGMGVTNLRPYWNLGFDPNDYIQAGVGHRSPAGNAMLVYAIHDDRLGSGQTNTHLVLRHYLPKEWRLTLDLVNEHGHGDGGLVVHDWAASVDVDWRRWFARVAHDPHVNYTTDHQWRVAAGVRF